MFLSRLQERSAKKEDDGVIKMDSKKGIFSVKFLYSLLEPRRAISFPVGIILEFLGPIKSKFFLLGKLLGESWISFRREGDHWQTNVFFAKMKRNQLITYSYIVSK